MPADTSSNKEQYRELCRDEPTVPLFSQDWWLDAVCGEDNWDVVLETRGESIVGSLPFYRTRLLGTPTITMPWLTQTMGPWVRPSSSKKNYKRVSNELGVTTALINKLPPHGLFEQRLHHSQTNWLPFYWKGFEQTTRYSHVIPDLTNLDKVWDECEGDVRRRVRKAQDEVEVVVSSDLAKFFEMHSEVFKKQGMKVPYTLDLIKKIDEACEEHGRRRLIMAVDANGEMHSADYTVCHGDCAIGLMSGIDPKFRSDCSYKLLNWEAIRFANKVAKRYDFGGSMLMPVEELNRAFGAVQVPYSVVTKINAPHLLALKTIVKLVEHGKQSVQPRLPSKYDIEGLAIVVATSALGELLPI